jgi:hypothetical protein
MIIEVGNGPKEHVIRLGLQCKLTNCFLQWFVRVIVLLHSFKSLKAKQMLGNPCKEGTMVSYKTARTSRKQETINCFNVT